MQVMSDDDLAVKFSEAAKTRAKITHNREINAKKLKEIYHKLEEM